MCKPYDCCLNKCNTWACMEYHLYYRCGAQQGPDISPETADAILARLEISRRDTNAPQPSRN